MKHLLIILISILLLSSPVIGQSSKYESVSQCVLQTMKENKLTGNDMFKIVKEECERILGNGKVGISKSQENVLFISVNNNELKWNKSKNRNTVGKYDGQIGNNLPNGFGVLKLDNGIIYEGDWLNGKYHGKGELTLGSGKYKGDKYIGDFINGFKDGVGTYFHKNGSKYKGQWKKDKFHGTGIYIWIDGGRYEGEFKMGLKHGKGKEILSDKWKGDKYDGEYSFGLKSGKGTYRFKNGDIYVGEFKNDKRHGQGKYFYSKGGEYIGEFKDGKFHGQGTHVLKNGSKYVGEFKHDKPHGHGTFTYLDGRKIVGEFRNGKSWKTTLYKNGNFVGIFKNGVKQK